MSAIALILWRFLNNKIKNTTYINIERKGFANTAIGVVIARIVEGILEDEKSVIPVSVYWGNEYGTTNVCMSIQNVIGLDGVKDRITPDLTDEKTEGLSKSANVLKKFGRN